MEELKKMVDSYITYRKSEEYHEDSDYPHFIYEAAVEAFYGKDIWKELN